MTNLMPRFFKEETESIQIHLLFISLNLGKVSVIGRVQREAWCNRILDIETNFGAALRAGYAASLFRLAEKVG